MKMSYHLVTVRRRKKKKKKPPFEQEETSGSVRGSHLLQPTGSEGRET